MKFKEIKNIKDGDIFIFNDQKLVAVGEYVDEISSVFTTIPKYWNKEGIYSYTSGSYTTISPKQEVKIIANIYAIGDKK